MAKKKRSLLFRLVTLLTSAGMGMLFAGAATAITGKIVARQAVVKASILSAALNFITGGTHEPSDVVRGLQFLSFGQDMSIGVLVVALFTSAFAIMVYRTLAYSK